MKILLNMQPASPKLENKQEFSLSEMISENKRPADPCRSTGQIVRTITVC